eukprot:12965816-Heterocapsa_arctica.AAC.1
MGLDTGACSRFVGLALGHEPIGRMEALRLIMHLGKDATGTAKIRDPNRWMTATTTEALDYLRNPELWLQAAQAALHRKRQAELYNTSPSSSRFA